MFVDNPSEEMQLEAVKQDWYAIVYIKNPSEAVQLEAVKKHGSVIQYIKNPSEAVQLIAIKKNGHGIKYIKNPSEAVQLIAVGQFSDTLKYIENPSEAVQLAAVKGNGYSIRYIKNPSEQVQMKAVEYIADVIKYIKNPSEAVQLAAVKANKKALQYIQNPTTAVIQAAKKRKRKSTSSMNESAGSKDELDFYKRFEGIEVEAKDDGEVFTIVYVEHDGFGIRFKLESNEADCTIIMELDEMDKYFTGFKPFENEEYWDGEDDEDNSDQLNETVYVSKYHRGDKLIHNVSGTEWTVEKYDFDRLNGFLYEISRPCTFFGEKGRLTHTASEHVLDDEYTLMTDIVDDNEDYWDGEDDEELMESARKPKYKNGQKLIHLASGDEWKVVYSRYAKGQGFLYEITKLIANTDEDKKKKIKYMASEKHLDNEYQDNSDIDSEDYWDGED